MKVKRLQTRLLLTFISIVVIALLLVVLFAMIETRNQFDAFLSRDALFNINQTAQLFRGAISDGDTVILQSLAEDVADTYQNFATVYDSQGNIVADVDQTQIGEVITDAPLPSSGLALRLVVDDEEIQVAYFFQDESGAGTNLIMMVPDSENFTETASIVMGQDMSEVEQGGLIESENTAQIFTLPISDSITAAPGLLIDAGVSQQTFWQFVNRAFVLAAIVSILVALTLSWFTSRQIVRPVKELAAAARKMGQGQLDTQVAVHGEDELAELGRSFNQMAADLSHQEDLRRSLVTDIAHELLTPLTTVRGSLEAIQDGVLTPEPELIRSLHEEVMLLDSLVAELQELSLAEAGKLKLDWQLASISELVEGAVAAVQPQANARNITLSTSIPNTLLQVQLDTRRIGQVLRNLLVNAVTHTEPGGEINVSATTTEDAVRVTIKDNGPGISPEDLPHIFDRFYRADKSRTRTTGGSGLGLAIVKGIVTAHHGQVWVQSQPGQGAKFSFTLPLKDDSDYNN